MWWFTSPKIVFGEDSLEQLSAIEGKRVLVVTDPVVRKLGMLEVVANELKKEPRAVEVFDQVEAEPSFENVEKVAAVARGFQPDLIVALGGGSCIDAAKAAWVLYERPDLKVDAVSPMTKLDLLKIGERIIMAKRIMNLRLGATVQDDRLPKHAMRPLTEGPTGGNVSDLNRQLKEYYAIRGWDPITGHPTEERLRALGIEPLSEYLPPRK